MDTERCRVLLQAIEEGSLTAAAQRLGYTPSGISRMMAALEEETGFPLLVRSRSGITPTEECRQLLPVMEELVRCADRYHQLSGEIAGLSRGTIRIGTSYYAYYDWFARLIAGFERAYPQITVEIVEGTSTELIQMMEERRADLCIISKRKGAFDWLPLKEDQLLACLPKGHPLAQAGGPKDGGGSGSSRRAEGSPGGSGRRDRSGGSGSFPVTAFAEEDFIELYPGKETDNSRMFAAARIAPRVKFSTSDNYAAYAMVAAGLGITCTNAIIAEAFTEGVVYLPLDPPWPVEIGIAQPPAREMSPAARRFAEYAKDRFR
ncbi:MAG: LysR family transcriptional regulator [Firmicutes bacterium]|nr:LysR family transcriptional regulator [Bacillota bacterium]